MMSKYRLTGGGQRESNLELFRIILMLGIVASHYRGASGLMDLVNTSNPLTSNSLFLLLFGCWGKVGINGFVLISGYFMCKSNITFKKFLKLVLEWFFYKYVILIIFIVTGYQSLSLRELAKAVIPFRTLTNMFTPCYVVFFLFIPFMNILIQNMKEKTHRYLVILVLGIFSVWASIPFVDVGSSYVFWFMAVYLVASYIRLYPIPVFDNTKFWGYMSLSAIVFSYLSVIFMAWVKQRFGYQDYFFFLSDSNKITSLIVALCFFMFFKNMKLKHIPWINQIAKSTFGVLCIHASSDEMRRWLWVDTLKNVKYFNSPYLVLHAFGAVLIVFTACTIIDQLRIKFIENPFFRFLDKSISSK